MFNFKNIFSKKDESNKHYEQKLEREENNAKFWNALSSVFDDEGESVVGVMPKTIAIERLVGGAKDVGADQARKMFNSVNIQVKNQWINPNAGLNSGYANAHNSVFLTQSVDYFKCFTLLQDPMMAKVIDLLSITPIAKRGIPTVSGDDSDDDMKDNYAKEARKFKLWETLEKALRSSYTAGGCLVYLDFGDDIDLEKPLSLKHMDEEDLKNFRGFKVIDAVYTAPVEVETTAPADKNFMNPEKWYVVGLGTVHRSHFLKFEFNAPAEPLRPLFLFYGMPLTQLIAQDIANCNLTSQGLANLLSRLRLMYLKTSDNIFATQQAMAFKTRLETMAKIANNYNTMPLRDDESIEQLVMQTTGLPESVKLFFQLLASKTGITISMLLAEGASGMNGGSLEGERKNFYDNCRSVQRKIERNVLTMFNVVVGATTGEWKGFDEMNWLPFEEASESELAQDAKAYAETASALMQLGLSSESVIAWLKSNKKLNFDILEIDENAGGMQGYEDDGGMQQLMEQMQGGQPEQPEQETQEQPVEAQNAETEEDITDRILEQLQGK